MSGTSSEFLDDDTLDLVEVPNELLERVWDSEDACEILAEILRG